MLPFRRRQGFLFASVFSVFIRKSRSQTAEREEASLAAGGKNVSRPRAAFVSQAGPASGDGLFLSLFYLYLKVESGKRTEMLPFFCSLSANFCSAARFCQNKYRASKK
jgi:hypothetical protein